MGHDRPSSATHHPHTVEAVAQFVTLMHARERGDIGMAREALLALEKLCIFVRFGHAEKTCGGVARG